MAKNTFTTNIAPALDHDGIGKIVAANTKANWIRVNPHSAINALSANELTSINALIAYVAISAGSSEHEIERRLSERFDVASRHRLPSHKFEDAVRFLVDCMGEIDKL